MGSPASPDGRADLTTVIRWRHDGASRTVIQRTRSTFSYTSCYIRSEVLPMTQPAVAANRSSTRTKAKSVSVSSRRIGDALHIAEQQGLLSGGRTLTIRGRMPSLLVEQARKKTGIQSDSKLLEAALANIAVADDYGEWLLSQRGTVSKDLDLEF